MLAECREKARECGGINHRHSHCSTLSGRLPSLSRGETGPSGGPAMTDVLGVCTSWGDGLCVVAPEAGEPVRIRLADIVSGKPVPPRPSSRHRVSALEAQRRALALWPDLETEPLGDWLLRRSRTATARPTPPAVGATRRT